MEKIDREGRGSKRDDDCKGEGEKLSGTRIYREELVLTAKDKVITC